MRDFNGAGKQAKRRRWRMKQACFEEGSQIADTQYSLISKKNSSPVFTGELFHIGSDRIYS